MAGYNQMPSGPWDRTTAPSAPGSTGTQATNTPGNPSDLTYTVRPDGLVVGPDGTIYAPPTLRAGVGDSRPFGDPTRADRDNINNGVWWIAKNGRWEFNLSRTLTDRKTNVGLTAEDTVLANIRDKIQLYLGRQATASEVETFKGQSDFRLMDYIRHDAAYANSEEYQQARAKLNDLSNNIWQRPADPAQIDEMVRGNWSLEHIQDFWRNTDEYKAMYEGKPADMDEATYRDRLNYFQTEADNQRFLHAKWAPGGVVPDNAGLKKAWMDDLSQEHQNSIKYKGWEAIHNFLQQKHGTDTLVTLSQAGPMEGLMKGSTDIQANVGGNGQAVPANPFSRYPTLTTPPGEPGAVGGGQGKPYTSMADYRDNPRPLGTSPSPGGPA